MNYACHKSGASAKFNFNLLHHFAPTYSFDGVKEDRPCPRELTREALTVEPRIEQLPAVVLHVAVVAADGVEAEVPEAQLQSEVVPLRCDPRHDHQLQVSHLGPASLVWRMTRKRRGGEGKVKCEHTKHINGA